ncbi:MAG: O-antigen ligase family protein [Alphaproteobacteria bacterium]|nr:O-antigen ligase family protein [Alphaproteobacteria bacterium]
MSAQQVAGQAKQAGLLQGLTGVDILMAIILATSSCEMILQVNVAGLNFRFHQLLMMLVIFVAGLEAIRTDRIIVPIGFRELMIWLGIGVVFLPNSPWIVRNIGYFFWAVLSSLTILAVVQIYGRSLDRFMRLLRIYILSFLFTSSFAALQFVAGLKGISLVTTQWLIEGRWARINGFTTEPSEYATYGLLGFISMVIWVFGGVSPLPRRTITLTLLLSALTLVLSTSRTAWAGILFIFVVAQGYILFKFLSGRRVHARTLRNSMLVTISILSIFTYIAVYHFYVVQFFAQGLGIFGGTAHSVDARTRAIEATLQLITQNPLVGVGFGGVGPNLYMNNHANFDVSTYVNAKVEGSNVFLEVIASTGIEGFLIFMFFIWKICTPFFRLRRRDEKMYIIIFGLTVSLIIVLISMMAGTNIFRGFIWYHIAILSAGLCVSIRGIGARNNEPFSTV